MAPRALRRRLGESNVASRTTARLSAPAQHSCDSHTSQSVSVVECRRRPDGRPPGPWGLPRLHSLVHARQGTRGSPRGFIAARWLPEALRQAQPIDDVVAEPVGFADETGIRRQITGTAVTATFLSRHRGQRRLQSPNGDGRAARLRVLPEHALFPRSTFADVEDQQVPRLRAAAIHVPGRLLSALADDALPAGPLPQHLAFNDMLVRMGRKSLPGRRPFHKHRSVRPRATAYSPVMRPPLLITRCR